MLQLKTRRSVLVGVALCTALGGTQAWADLSLNEMYFGGGDRGEVINLKESQQIVIDDPENNTLIIHEKYEPGFNPNTWKFLAGSPQAHPTPANGYAGGGQAGRVEQSRMPMALL